MGQHNSTNDWSCIVGIRIAYCCSYLRAVPLPTIARQSVLALRVGMPALQPPIPCRRGMPARRFRSHPAPTSYTSCPIRTSRDSRACLACCAVGVGCRQLLDRSDESVFLQATRGHDLWLLCECNQSSSEACELQRHRQSCVCYALFRAHSSRVSAAFVRFSSKNDDAINLHKI